MLAVIAFLGACSSGEGKAFEPLLVWGACPADVEVTFISRHECGMLTVLENRAKPNGKTIDLLVVKVWPVGVDDPPAEFGTGFGGDIGDPFSLSGGIATGATRWGNIVVQMESRGAGPHSAPSLRCIEADGLAVRAASVETGDPGLEAAFVDAVGACATRLRAAGYDPAAYGVAETAADVEDLRVAVGLDRWAGIGSQGTTSRVVFEYLRTHPDRTSTAVTDSPWFPDVDDLTGGVIGTRAALDALFAACSADQVCAAAYPDLERTWQSALDHLSDRPIRATYVRTDGSTMDVVIDAPKLLRIARFAFGGDGPTNLTGLPATIAAAADGRAAPWLVETLAKDQTFCVGYRPFCTGQDGFSLGSFLTAFCGDQAGLIHDEELTALIGGDPVYEEVFAASPYRKACEAWGVPPGDPAIAQAVNTDVPLLMLSGQFDSFSPPSLAARVAERLPTAWSFTVPAQTHNVLGYSQCVIDIRNKWRRQPTSPPEVDGCASTPPLTFATDAGV